MPPCLVCTTVPTWWPCFVTGEDFELWACLNDPEYPRFPLPPLPFTNMPPCLVFTIVPLRWPCFVTGADFDLWAWCDLCAGDLCAGDLCACDLCVRCGLWAWCDL